MNIPLIIPNFNLLSYTKNLINWWHFYYPDNKVIIIDNGSTYRPLLDFYSEIHEEGRYKNVNLVYNMHNNFRDNLKLYLENSGHEYYVISDPDIMPHPSTPYNFLEIYKNLIDNHQFHHVGFQLIIDDLPSWANKKDWIIFNEGQLRNHSIEIAGYKGHKAPIDTTFALYKASNGGWQSPMPGTNWDNCVRMFSAYHLPWYLDGEHLTPEMSNYFNTANRHKTGEPSAGSNNHRPKGYE